MTMVQAESHFIQIGIAIVLGNGCPSMTKGVVTIVVIFLHSHIHTNLSDADIHVGIEAVGIAVTLMKIEKVFIPAI